MEFDSRGLKKLINNAKELQDPQKSNLSQVLNDSFISSKTPYNDLSELLEKGGFQFETLEEFEAIPDEDLNAFIASISEYDTFQEMVTAASVAFMRSKLLKGL